MKHSFQNKRIAIVCDWIKDWGGAEVVLTHMLEMFPQADIYTSVFFQEKNPVFHGKKVTTSFIQKIPFLNKRHKLSLLLRPQAFESFDLTKYDIVISSTSAESKGVITKPHCLHICYCHTPTRYFWSHYDHYKSMLEFGLLNPLARICMPVFIRSLRRWDCAAAQRPDFFIANSKNTQQRIEKYYDRKSKVIYPGLDTSSIPYLEKKDDYYFYAGRIIPYKKFDLIVETFNANGLSLKIVANTKNTLSEKLRKISKPNIEWIYETDNSKINTLHSKAKAFLFPPEEDFGLAPIAAMASGTPLIAYGKGGALETVVEGKTGTFFQEQTVESIQKAIERFESLEFDPQYIRTHAESFDTKIFQKNLMQFIKSHL